MTIKDSLYWSKKLSGQNRSPKGQFFGNIRN